jgi:hypothetical protein
MRQLFQWCGVEAPVRVTRGGKPVSAVEVVRFEDGQHEYVGLYRDYRLADRNPTAAQIELGRQAVVYDVRGGRKLGRTDTISTTLESGRVELYALLPHEVTSLSVAPEITDADAGQTVTFQCRLAAEGPLQDRHVLHVEVIGPDGLARPHHARNLECSAGHATATVPTALNDAPGPWRIKVRDVISGLRAEAAFNLHRGDR